MVTFEIFGTEGNKTITLPTSLKEFTREYLRGVTANIQVAENYSLIGVCYREKLSNILFQLKNKSEKLTTSVVPIFIKTCQDLIVEDNKVKCLTPCCANTGDKIIIAPSQIAVGHHAVAPLNTLSIDYILHLAKNDGTAYSRSLQINNYVYFLEFKIVPNCDIIGVYNDNDVEPFENPFVVRNVAIEGV